MRSVSKVILVILTVVFALAAVAVGVLDFTGVLVDQGGWEGDRYLDRRGHVMSGWQEIDGRTYYFDPHKDKTLAKGWTRIEDQLYYFDEENYPVTGWMDLDGKRYYLDENGVLTTGWLCLEDGT